MRPHSILLPSEADAETGRESSSPHAPTGFTVDGKVRAEDSPLWPVTLILAEIATRVARCQTEECAALDDEAA